MYRKKLIAAMLVAMSAAVSGTQAYAASGMDEGRVRELSEQIGEQYHICPELLQSIAWSESRYDPKASGAGCEGLMQVAERWHEDRMERLGVSDLYDPEENMRVAADYLLELFAEYEDPGMVLMVYNGDSRAEHYQKTGEGLSDYAGEILEMSERLEREHGK